MTRWKRMQAGANRLLGPIDHLRWYVAAPVGLAVGGAVTWAGLSGGTGATVAAVGAVLGLAVPLALTGEAVVDEPRRKRADAPPRRTPETGREPISPPVAEAAPEPDSLVEMVRLLGGTFDMGSPEDEPERSSDEHLHAVTVSPFVIMTTPVTRGLWRQLMNENRDDSGGADDLPVVAVTWFDALQFCNALSRREGRRECYSGADQEWHCDWSADGYRLPTEAEWEYACRAGTTTRFSSGDDEETLKEHAWFDVNSEMRPHPVKTRLANRWGLFDMHGNVWEWCWDYYQGGYEDDRSIDPIGPESGSSRVVRGGSFGDGSGRLRAAFRDLGLPGFRNVNQGFRCVRGVLRQRAP